MSALPPYPNFATKAVHDGQDAEKWNSRAVIPPISLATTFKQDGPGEFNRQVGVFIYPGYEYSRSGNPTRDCFEECVAGMEGGKHCITFASGMGAITIILLSLEKDAHIVSMDDVYGGTNCLFSKVWAKRDLNFDFVDMRNVELVEKSIIPGKTKLIWIETPTNPTMKIVDIKAVCEVAHRYEGVKVLVDNTFMSPYFQRPLSLGADVVLHSVTKYINGHSDVVMGVVVTSDDDIHKQLRFLQNAAGYILSPFDCFLANRGAKTLHVRMQQHQANALKVAEFLENHPMVTKVIYPGLKSHPQHELINRQCTGYSGMTAFVIKGELKHAKTFLQTVKLFAHAGSLGGIESLVEHPVTLSHASVDAVDRERLGISDTFIRISVGIENVEGLVEDIRLALEASEKC